MKLGEPNAYKLQPVTLYGEREMTVSLMSMSPCMNCLKCSDLQLVTENRGHYQRQWFVLAQLAK